MLKPMVQVAALGVVGVVIWKLAFFLLIPLVGLAAGFVFAILKIALIVGAILFVVWFLKKKGGEEKADGATGG